MVFASMRILRTLVIPILGLTSSFLSMGEARSVEPFRFVQSELLAFDPDEACLSPNQSPICAARLFAACFIPGSTQENCRLIGLEVPTTPPPGPAFDFGPEPWRKNLNLFTAWVGDFEICSFRPMLVRPVGPDRFEADPPLDPSLIGTHEVVLYYGNCPYGPEVILWRSVFLRETDQGWMAASWQWGLLQDDDDVPVQFDFNACDDVMCRYRAAGIAAPSIPIRANYVPFATAPVFLPDRIVQCAFKIDAVCGRPPPPRDPDECRVFSATDPAACEKK
jgi:hypothetical protein